jgi:bifunctional DNase/RNase
MAMQRRSDGLALPAAIAIKKNKKPIKMSLKIKSPVPVRIAAPRFVFEMEDGSVERVGINDHLLFLYFGDCVVAVSRHNRIKILT